LHQGFNRCRKKTLDQGLWFLKSSTINTDAFSKDYFTAAKNFYACEH